MSEWRHLPNAAHIDRIIADAQARPDVWAAAWDVSAGAAWDATRHAAWDAAWDAIQSEESVEACSAALNAAWGAAWGAAYATRHAVYDAAQDAAQDAILALVAYDDCAQYLTMTPDEMKVWYQLSEHPACILLLPAVIALEKEII